MFKDLWHLLQRPGLYEKTDVAFWNDPHISAGMLSAHLDPNTDAASRKPAFIDASANWIASLLPRGADLLDIGCGPGLYAKRLSALGLRVTGLDFSERSIAYAKEHAPNADFILGNYLEMDFEGAFDMVTLIWCDYGALIPEERGELLRRVFRALKPGGLFLFDVFAPRAIDEGTSWEICESGGFWSKDPHICLNAQYSYGDTVDMHRHVIIEGGKVRSFNIWNTGFTRQSLAEELALHGFACVDFYADVAGAVTLDDSQTLCAVAKKAEA